MDTKLTNQVIQQGANELSIISMRERRDQILDYVDAAEQAGQQLPAEVFKELMGELFDLNIAIGDTGLGDKDGGVQ